MKKMVKKLSFILLTVVFLLSLLPMSAFAAQSGDFTYEVRNGKATVTGYTGDSVEVTIPSKLGGYPVTAIGDYAFNNNGDLEDVTISAGVTNIGESAFYSCSSLWSISIPDSVTSIGDKAFQDCSNLWSLTIPNNVTSIGDEAFESTGLTNVLIPAGVTNIGSQAFYRCFSLSEIDVDASNTTFMSQDGVLFDKAKTILIQYPIGNTGTSYAVPDGVTSIGQGAFLGCIELVSVAIPSSVTSIGDDAFGGKNLSTINVDASNTKYASQSGVLFNKAKTTLILCPSGNARTSYTIPNGVICIGNWAFDACSNLTSITIPASVTSIKEDAFAWCYNLKSITIPDSVKIIGDWAFTYCRGLTTVKISASVTSIGKNVFNDCESLTSVTIPVGVTSIGESAFDYCIKLKSVSIPGSVKIIGAGAFACTNLISVTIPASVTSIGAGAFNGCKNLASAFFQGNAPKLDDNSWYVAAGDGVFQGCKSNFTVYYLKGKTGYTNPWYGYIITKAYPTAPTGVKTVSASYNSVKLTWSAAIGSNGYEVWRATSKTGTYTKVGTSSINSYTNTGLTTNTTYYYKVKAYASADTSKVYSDYSAVVSAKPVLTAPAGVKAASVSYDSIKMIWGAVAGASGYDVYRATSVTGTYSKITTTTGSTLSYTNTGLTAGHNYYYKVRAYRLVGSVKVYGNYSAIMSTKPVPAVPTGVKAERASSTSIKVSWGTVAGATKYEVYRATASGETFKIMATTSSLSWTNTGLTTGKTYWYKVRAYHLEGTTKVYGGYSVTVSAKP